MQKQRSAPNRETRIFDTWLDDPGPYLELTGTENRRYRAIADEGFGSSGTDADIDPVGAASESARGLL